MKEIKKQEKANLISHALYGKVRLEHYKERGFVVSFKGNKEVFWLDWDRLKKIIEKFDELVKIKQNLIKKNGKQD